MIPDQKRTNDKNDNLSQRSAKKFNKEAYWNEEYIKIEREKAKISKPEMNKSPFK